MLELMDAVEAEVSGACDGSVRAALALAGARSLPAGACSQRASAVLAV